MTAIDPITLGVIHAGLQQVCDEMDLTFSRSAFSPVIAEADDRSDGIYDADTGALIAQGEGGLPVFVGLVCSRDRNEANILEKPAAVMEGTTVEKLVPDMLALDGAENIAGFHVHHTKVYATAHACRAVRSRGPADRLPLGRRGPPPRERQGNDNHYY